MSIKLKLTVQKGSKHLGMDERRLIHKYCALHIYLRNKINRQNVGN
jgi:hypothetical protein